MTSPPIRSTPLPRFGTRLILLFACVFASTAAARTQRPPRSPAVKATGSILTESWESIQPLYNQPLYNPSARRLGVHSSGSNPASSADS